MKIIWTGFNISPNGPCRGGWPEIFKSLVAKKKKLPIDGVMLDLSSETFLSNKFFDEIDMIRYDLLVWCVMPHSVVLLDKMDECNILFKLYRHFDNLVINTFGFFKFEPTSGRLLAASDSKFEDLQILINWLEEFHAIPNFDTVILGIDTLTTVFDVYEDSLFAYNMTLEASTDPILLNSPEQVKFYDREKD